MILIVTVAVLLTVSEIFSCVEVENRHFAHCILIVDPSGGTTVCQSLYTVSGKKSLQYCMCNFNKFKDIFIMFGINHPETPLY